MMANFFDLPGELRNRIYELCLLHKAPLALWTGFNQRHELSPGLLRANKALHHEATSLFYAQNRFDFTIATPKRIAMFLQTIGCKNAGYIQHLYVEFPKFYYQEPGNITVSDDSISIFSSIRSSCANLSTLTAFTDSGLTIDFALNGLDNPDSISKALNLVDTLFKAISPSLKRIIVGVYNNDPGNFITGMENRGWTVKATKVQFSL
ncbi:hypothetical protein O988_01709 [Pseudogymnoascus sp. VKM F-3808]|nr:hypothetical protein O988_01709 [Pseudogymnoascus sp. VKM F-3808]